MHNKNNHSHYSNTSRAKKTARKSPTKKTAGSNTSGKDKSPKKLKISGSNTRKGKSPSAMISTTTSRDHGVLSNQTE